MMKEYIYICFPEGRNKVLTMSYDDGQHHDIRLAGIFRRNGIKATFHLNSGFMQADMDPQDTDRKVRPEEVREVYRGFEVSCHTAYHPTLTRCDITQTVRQIINDRLVLEQACGYPVRGMSYPNGRFNSEIEAALPACGIEYCRTGNETGNFEMPENFLRWNPTCHHNHGLMEKAKEFMELNKSQYLYMMYVFGHSFEFYRENTWELIEEFCKVIGYRGDIWYASNIEIADYMNAAHRLKFSAAGDMVFNPSSIPVWISAEGKIIKVSSGKLIQI